LIDPYWTILPPIYAIIWAVHPLAINTVRSKVCMGLVMIWATRLTHNYFRREENLTSYKLDYVAGHFIGDYIKTVTNNGRQIKTTNLTGWRTHCEVSITVKRESGVRKSQHEKHQFRH
jgi:hypothetical protein